MTYESVVSSKENRGNQFTRHCETFRSWQSSVCTFLSGLLRRFAPRNDSRIGSLLERKSWQSILPVIARPLGRGNPVHAYFFTGLLRLSSRNDRRIGKLLAMTDESNFSSQ